MSVVLVAALSALVVLSSGYLVRTRRDRKARSSGGSTGAPADMRRPRTEQCLFALGDVVSFDGHERWLAGAVLASEQGRVVAAIWLAPEGAAEHAVATFAPPNRSIYWLEPAAASAPGEPPATIDLDGVVMHRRRRLPVALNRIGQGAPELGDTGILALYEAGGHDVGVLVESRGHALAWSGRKVEPGDYERLGEGGVPEEDGEG